jgi:hypothetical protein
MESVMHPRMGTTSEYACTSSTDGMQAAIESDGEDVLIQDDASDTSSNEGSSVVPGVSGTSPVGASGAAPGGVSIAAPGQVSGEVPGGVSGNTEAVKPGTKYTIIGVVIIAAIAVGAALILSLILSVVIWKCRSWGARRRRENTQENANWGAPDIPHHEMVATHDVCDPFGTPPVSAAKGGHMSPYGYQCAPVASLP